MDLPFTIINVANVTDLDNWISQARSGGGMGYAIGGNSGTSQEMP